ncbi:hypothetical protein [Streptomyces sp. SP18CS02]|nr:hypothetical protein [Streptomyces sp. SP18CS02]MEE1753106.1 hypothetical protein [Streptomyces sp. SP18CS02]
MGDKSPNKWSKTVREFAARVAVALSVRALWAVIMESARDDL